MSIKAEKLPFTCNRVELQNCTLERTKSKSYNVLAGIYKLVFYLSPDETLGTVHGDGPDGVLSQVLGHLQDEAGFPAGHVQGVQDLGESILELDVDDGTDDGQNLALVGGGLGGILLDA